MRWPWQSRPWDGSMPSGTTLAGPGGSRTWGSGPDSSDATVRRPLSGPDRPVWLLDVDGVLNASRPGWDDEPAEGWAQADHGRFRIRWSPQLIRRIVALDQAGSVEIRWATTWVPWVERIESLLGTPHWASAYASPYEGAGTPARPTPWRKLDAAHDVVEAEQRALIWTDDDAIPGPGDDLDRLTGAGPPVLLIRPDWRHGLAPAHLHAIEGFVRSGGREL